MTLHKRAVERYRPVRMPTSPPALQMLMRLSDTTCATLVTVIALATPIADAITTSVGMLIAEMDCLMVNKPNTVA